MKTKITLSLMAGALALVIGCSQQEETAPAEETAGETSEAVTTSAPESRATGLAQETNTSVEAMQETAEEMTAAAEETAQEATEAVEETAAEVQSQFTAIVAEVKEYIAEEKYQEGLQAIQGLANLELTEEQQQIVDDLKAQLESAMSSDAAQAVGNLLGGDN